MIIASNKARFSNITNDATGTLRTPGDSSTGANDKFLGFKPAAVCKKSGYLRVTGYGHIVLPAPNSPLTVRMVFSRTGLDYFWVKVLDVSSIIAIPGNNRSLFSFTVDIPVGTSGHSELNPIAVTSHYSNASAMYEAWAYISADPDDVWTASFAYEAPTPAFGVGQIKIDSVIAEYKEN